MNTQTLHLLGKNNHIGGVDLYIGTEDELLDIATTGNNEIFEVSPEEKDNPDSLWPEGPGWYYAIGDRRAGSEQRLAEQRQAHQRLALRRRAAHLPRGLNPVADNLCRRGK
jgi:hypothetical protein